MKGENLSGIMPTAKLAEAMAAQGQCGGALDGASDRHSLGADRPYTGEWLINMQANLIGLNMPALRAHDILRGVDLLSARSDVDPTAIRGAARWRERHLASACNGRGLANLQNLDRQTSCQSAFCPGKFTN